jgi:hypothetical protein
MTPEAVLVELLDRIGAHRGGAILISAQELSAWPDVAVAAMKSQRFLTKGRPATRVVCSGCERECVMPAHVLADTTRGPEAFVICDKRSDINRVPVPVSHLEQWQVDAAAIAHFIAADLSLRFNGTHLNNDSLLQIGMAVGDKRTQMLCLRCDGDPVLVADSSVMPLAEAIRFQDGRYILDLILIRQLVDAATTGDTRYTPSTARREVRKLETEAMREQWRKEYRALKKKRPNMSDVWCSQQIAKLEIAQGRDMETIRKQMKK